MAGPAHSASPVPLPSAPLISLSTNASLQPPLSRRGHGPGIIVIDPAYELAPFPTTEPPSETLDPQPQYKWAEEGYAVVRIVIRKDDDRLDSDWAVSSGILQATEALNKLEECDVKDKFAVLVYGTPQEYPSNFLQDLRVALDQTESICACVTYSSQWNLASVSRPQMIHEPGKLSPNTRHPDTTVYSYPAESSSTFVIPGFKGFSYSAASVSHTRSLTFIKKHLGGPIFDLEKIWDEHTYYEFEDRSVEQTMGTMVLEPYVNHIPTMTGGIGRSRLMDFYRHHFIWNNPDDTSLDLVSRTIGIDRVVDEFIFSFTHNKEVDWLIPGIPTTNVPLRIPFTSVVNIRGDRLYHEHIAWDQATVLRQLGMLPEYLPFPHVVPGYEGKKLECKVPAAGVETAMKLENQRSVESNGLFVAAGAGVREIIQHG
ncbi:hypothetical protein G7046_g7275 [Stylonectria norvegica]|nr:hypothetical protein G7046_g7275 [Stylonectria norvegica]